MDDSGSWIREIISAEITQKREEGCDPTPLIEEYDGVRSSASFSELEEFWCRLESLEPRPNFPYEEPSTLREIREKSDYLPRRRSGVDIQGGKMLGAWLGRCVGCLLGKPVEGWSRVEIEEYLRGKGEYPLDDYFPGPESEKKRPGPLGIRGSINCMPRDDDIDYTILGLHILETYGQEVESSQIASELLLRLPYMAVYTAERIAYRNLVNMIPIPKTAVYLNPYREWIGAQIRADPWGYALPGNPSAAAQLAFRDARISHVKNGIYGEMMMAAMISEAFVSDDLGAIIDVGISVIPKKSRLHEAVERLRGWADGTDSWEDCWRSVKREYGHYSPVHIINNALNVVLALLYGGGKFSQSICIAVMGGWDTDCNGATVGSIMGAMKGASGIPSRWKLPLNDTVKSGVLDYQKNRISEMAARTLKVAKSQV